MNTITPTTAVGEIIQTRTTFFIGAEQTNIDLTVETIDTGGNVMGRRTNSNVPFQKNRATFLRGALFSASSSASFLVNTEFLPDQNLTF